jgi:hypothetical protein
MIFSKLKNGFLFNHRNRRFRVSEEVYANVTASSKTFKVKYNITTLFKRFERKDDISNIFYEFYGSGKAWRQLNSAATTSLTMSVNVCS